MIWTPLLIVGAICNAIYCAVKIRQDFQQDRAAFGVVGVAELLGATFLSLTAILVTLLTSGGELT